MKPQLTFDDVVRWATPVASFLAEIQPAWDRMVAAATADPAVDYDEIAEFEAEVEGYEDEDVMVDDEGNAVDMGTAEPRQHPRVWGPGEEPEIGLIDRAAQITAAEAKQLAAEWRRTGVADRAALADARAALADARRAALEAAPRAAWRAAWFDAATAWEAAEAARAADRAALVRDLISDEHYQALAGPWESVMGPIFETSKES